MTAPNPKEALEECIAVLQLVEQPAIRDPDHREEVGALGDRIGFGALMSAASAEWRERLLEEGALVGGEFVAGPCRATVLEALAKARAALATKPDGERREEIARALAEKWPGDYMHGDDECEREPNALAYEVADVALSSVGLSSAAICALEESRSLVEWLLEGRELDDMDQIRIGKWSAACQKADALATFQPDSERPSHILCIGMPVLRCLAAGEAVWIESIQAGAVAADDFPFDLIFASGLLQDENSIRADEREKCHKAARKAILELSQDERKSGDICDHAITTAIRSARNGGGS